MNNDEIIVNQLKRSNYPNSGDFANCAKVTSQQLIHCCIFLFNNIPETQGQVGEPPKSKALQFKFATQLAELAKGLNFVGDLSYDMFLNPKEERTRAIVRFLLSKMPSKQSKVAVSAVSNVGSSPLIGAAHTAFNEAKKKKKELLEPICQPLNFLNSGVPEATKKQIHDALMQPKIPYLAVPIAHNGVSFAEQCGRDSFASLLAINDRESNIENLSVGKQKPDISKIKKITKRAFVVQPVTIDFNIQAMTQQPVAKAKITSHLENIARFEYGTNDTNLGSTVVAQTKTKKKKESKVEEGKTPEEQEQTEGGAAEEEKKPEEEEKPEEPKEPPLTNEQIARIKAELKEEKEQTLAQLRAIEQQVNELEQLIEQEQDEYDRLSDELEDLKKENSKLEIELEKVKKVAQVSASDAREIKKLRSELVDSVSKIVEIANKFEQKRVALINEYRQIQTALRRKDSDRQLNMNRIAKLRKLLDEADVKIQNANSQISELSVAVEDQGDQLHRHHYVEMIFEQLKKIEKQEEEVEKVRNDIRSQNQRMNQTIETVKRTWQLVDETIYSKAKEKNQEWMKKSYKNAVELLTLYEGISEDVEQSGKITARTIELETKIERLQESVDPEALERVMNDLATVQEEIDQIRGGLAQDEEDEQEGDEE